MTLDWIGILKEQTEIAQRLAVNVPAALLSRDLTLDQASRLYRDVEHGAQAFDALADKMQDHDLDEGALNLIETIEDVWTSLSVAAANKVRTMQGLEPFEPIADDEEY